MTKTEADSVTFYRFSVEQYHRMDELGFFANARVELLEGCLVRKEPLHPLHELAMLTACDVFDELPGGWRLRFQAPITLADSEPEPAVAVVTAESEHHAERYPGAGEVAFALEVAAAATVELHRVTMGRIYARAGIPVYWLVNLPQQQLEVYTQPHRGNPPAYRKRQVYGAADSAMLPIGTTLVGPIAVADLLPPA
jgi:Uma2 family endonuclease